LALGMDTEKKLIRLNIYHMKGGTVRVAKGKSFSGPKPGKSFQNPASNAGSGWQGMGKKSIVSSLKKKEDEKK